MALAFGLFSICPRVTKSAGKLVAATAWRMRILTLGLVIRTVTVDPKKAVVQFSRRWFWIFHRRTRLRFQAIEAITYGYSDEAPAAMFTWAHDSIDLFTVGLRLYSGEERHLFYFLGDGTFTNHGPWPDWLYWDDYLYDMSGTQERESRAFVELLAKMIGVPVIPGRR